VLRTSLALSLVTGQPFVIDRIRAGRRKPGLLRQHLTAVRAATQIGRATVQGDAMGSCRLSFEPGTVSPGEYRFAVGTAGSATLVLQAVLPALLTAPAPSRLTLEGGTHNQWAPPFDFLERTFLGVVNRMGPLVTARLERHGFYPAGGGRFTVEIQPASGLEPLELMEPGDIVARHLHGIVSRLPRRIAEVETEFLRKKLGWQRRVAQTAEVPSDGPGNVVLAEIERDTVHEVFTGFGQQGVPAERVAMGVVRQVRDYLRADVPVGPHLAEQLLIPLAMAGGGRFRTVAPTRHTRTNAEVVERFLPVEVQITEDSPRSWQVSMDRRDGSEVPSR